MAGFLSDTVEALGYWGIALLMFLENVIPPIPSELIMPLGGFAATQGELNLALICLAGTVGSVVGQLPLYYLGYALGPERLKAFFGKRRWLLVDPSDIDRADDWFHRHGRLAVLLCRLVPGVRTFISIPAGVHRMPLSQFLLYSTLGMGFWATALAVAGYALGRNYDKVANYLAPVSTIALIALGVALVVWLARKKRERQA